MQSQSFNSQNLGSSPFAKLKLIMVVISIVGVSYAAGLYTKPVLASRAKGSVSSICTNYLSSLKAGKYDDAYRSSAQSLQATQTAVEFSTALSGLSAKDVTTQKPTTTIGQSGNVASCDIAVDGLTPDVDGSTQGLLSIQLVNNSGWEVALVSLN